MTAVHVVVPDGIDDPTRPSGGNAYDLQVCRGLAAIGVAVRVHAVPGPWPLPDAPARAALAAVVRHLPDGAVALLDGLVASTVPEVLVPEAGRLRLVVLVHMPLGEPEEAGEARTREGAVLRAAAGVVATSAFARRTLRRLYALPGDRVHVAEPGVDLAELAPGTATAGAFLCVAAVIPGKGHDVLLDALASLDAQRWECRCVGTLERDPAFAAKLLRRTREAGLDERLSFAGALSAAALAASYAAADLLVLPTRGETYGMVVTEALARGLPVVASDVGGVPEALGHCADGTRPGLLVPPDDPAALADALRAWLGDAALRERLRRAARERRASLRSWSTTAAAVAAALRGAAA